jgi:hypothetical protein
MWGNWFKENIFASNILGKALISSFVKQKLKQKKLYFEH